MTTTANAKPTTIKLAPNVPFRMTVRYVDVWPNDTTKNAGKGYGPSLCLTGANPAGEAVRFYPPGKLPVALAALTLGGVIAPGQYSLDPAQKYNIPVQRGDVEIVLEQGPGDKYAEIAVNGHRGDSPNGTPPTQAVPQAAAPASQKQPVSYGGPVPGLDAPEAVSPLDAATDRLGRCLRNAQALATAHGITEQRAVVAIAATLYIETRGH